MALQPNAGHGLLLRFLDHTQRRTTVGRTPLDKSSARPRDLYLTTHNTHNRQTSMPPVGFEPTFPAGERPQTYALDRAATGTVQSYTLSIQNNEPAKSIDRGPPAVPGLESIELEFPSLLYDTFGFQLALHCNTFSI